MANKVYIPKINPLNFVDENETVYDQYATRHMDDFLFIDRKQEFDGEESYKQFFTVDDILKIYYEANFGPVQVEIWNADGLVQTYSTTPLRTNRFQPDYYVSLIEITLADYDEGCYQARITGDGVSLISEVFEIKNISLNSLLIQYRNSSFYEDVLFEIPGLSFNLRVQGHIKFDSPGGKFQVYEDQVLNETMLSARTYNIYKMFIGGERGVSDWMIDKLNRIIGCDDLLIDGKAFCLNNGSKWEPSEVDGYRLKGYSLEMREGFVRDSKIYGAVPSHQRKILVAHISESKTFADISENGSSNNITILSAE